jgi:hypothetical protein
MYKLAQQEEERNLFTDFGPHCRALSARLDNFFYSLPSKFKGKQYLAFYIDADPNSVLQTSVVGPVLDPFPEPDPDWIRIQKGKNDTLK